MAKKKRKRKQHGPVTAKPRAAKPDAPAATTDAKSVTAAKKAAPVIAASASASVETAFATIPLRALAFLLDCFVITLIYYSFMIVSFYTAGSEGLRVTGFSAWSSLLVWLLSIVYFTLLEWRWQTTPGKRACGLAVRHVSGRGLRLKESFARNILRIVDAIPFFIPYLLGAMLATGSDKRQRLGDAAAQSVVVAARKQKLKVSGGK